MNKNAIIGIIAIALLLVGGLVTWHFTGHAGLDHSDHSEHSAHEHHGDHGASATKLALNDGEKWATDEHLRDGMSTIHDRAKPAFVAYKKGGFGAAEAREVAELVRAQVDMLIENCELDPEADAMLHIVIGDMMAAASAMENDPESEEGMPKLVGALQAYSKHFDHPDF